MNESKPMLSRPPFDENGYAMWEETEKPKKKKTPLWWMIPAGLLVIFAIVGIAVKLWNRHTPEELCRYAIADAYFGGFGYEDPLMRELRFAETVELLKSGRFGAEFSVNCKESSFSLVGTPLEEPLAEQGLPADTSLLAGLGFAIDGSVWDGELAGRLRASYSVIRLTILEGACLQNTVYLSAPKLYGSVLSAKRDALANAWEQLPQWSLLPEKWRQTGTALIESGARLSTQVQKTWESVKQAFYASNDTTGEFLNRVLSCFSYEKLTDEDGKQVTKKLAVGKKMTTCDGYRIVGKAQASAEVLTSSFDERAAMLEFAGENDGDIEAVLYLTEDAQLVLLETTLRVTVDGRAHTLALTWKCTGESDPQHVMEITAELTGGEMPYSVCLKKNTKETREEVFGRWTGELLLGESTYGIVCETTVDRLKQTVEFSGNTYWDERTIGEYTANATQRFEDEGVSVDFADIELRDTFSDETMRLAAELVLMPLTEAPKRPAGTVLDAFSMDEETLAAMKAEVLKNVKWYKNLLGELK